MGKLVDSATLGARDSVRSKLLRALMGIWIFVNVATLAAVGAGQYRASRESAQRTELRVRENQREKGRLLIVNHARALRGMALDNAFSDVRDLVSTTVLDDADVIYGVFVDASSLPWIVVTPKTPDSGLSGADAKASLAAIPTEAERPRAPGARVRPLDSFGVHIEEHAADVFDGADYLGTIRYGMSMARTEMAVIAELGRARRSLGELMLLLVLLGASGAVMGVFAIRRVANRITQPLSALAKASEELGRGNRDVRVTISSGDEIEQLAHTFNEMAESNQVTMQELEVKTAEALESSRLKSEFLANMSHEIRTPMNGILGVVRLAYKMPLDGKLRRYVETIDSSASALLTIINDVLDFSKMEAGKYTLKRVAFDLQTVVQEVCELLATRAQDKGVELVCRIDPRMSSLHHGDPDRLRQVVNNLVGNAIKFTERGEVFVDVRLEERQDRSESIRIVVIDSGIGIAQSDIPKLFDAFSQVDGSMVRKFGGTGLGLAISKRLVEMMGGKIGVKSALGEGSEFFVDLRLDVASDVSTDRGIWANGRRAVVIESHERWQSVIREHLQAWGMEVECFHRADEALGNIRASATLPFDVAVIGTELGELKVEEFIKQLRELPFGQHLPIIALYQLSSGALMSDVEKEIAAQLPKPLRFSELYNVLQESLAGERAPSGKTRLSGDPGHDVHGRVLVVDDNEINRFVAAETLEQMGYEVETAENGAVAVEKVASNDYLAVLMDCQMPVMDGYTATREIRRQEVSRNRHQIVIALTAHALSGERDKVMEAGMDDYLSKPVRPNALDKMIRRHAKGRIRNASSNGALVSAAVVEDLALDPTVPRSRRLVEIFRRNLPEQLDDIENAVKSGQPTELRRFAHKTKGSCGAIGAIPMSKCAEQLQRIAEAGNLEGASTLVVELRAQYRRVDQELERELTTKV